MSFPAPRPGTFNNLSVAIITFLFTGCLALMIALAGATKPTSYDRDQAFIKASITENAQSIADLTKAVQSLAVQQAATQQQVESIVHNQKGTP